MKNSIRAFLFFNKVIFHGELQEKCNSSKQTLLFMDHVANGISVWACFVADVQGQLS